VAVLVTRPQPDNELTASALRARGFGVLLAPMLRFEPVSDHDDSGGRYGAVVVTSANALRGAQPDLAAVLSLPLFAVGERTAEAARETGFRDVAAAEGDVAALRELIVKSARAKKLRKTHPLLYLAGADLAGDLAGELEAEGFQVVTRTTYRMVPVSKLPQQTIDAFAASAIEAVLHYSRRSARAFLDAARGAGVEISALAIPQCCISDSAAAVLREAGATQLAVARTADENGLFEALQRALATPSR
jgi:uroporphyrinogen-III synthase